MPDIADMISTVMSNRDLRVGVVFVGLIGLLLVFNLIKRFKRPKTFRCARCHREVPHNRRTLEAWCSGKERLYCPECHRKWRESHPAVRETASGRGCMLPMFEVLSFLSFCVCVVMQWIPR